LASEIAYLSRDPGSEGTAEVSGANEVVFKEGVMMYIDFEAYDGSGGQ